LKNGVLCNQSVFVLRLYAPGLAENFVAALWASVVFGITTVYELVPATVFFLGLFNMLTGFAKLETFTRTAPSTTGNGNLVDISFAASDFVGSKVV
jgi:hypothetical protein